MRGIGLSCTRLLRAAIAIALTLSSLDLLAADPRTVFAQASRSVLVIEVLDKGGVTLSVHSAIAVEERRAVSTCNVLVGAPGLAVRVGEKQLKATVKAQDSQRNLCLLDVPGLSVPQCWWSWVYLDTDGFHLARSGRCRYWWVPCLLYMS